MSVKSKLKSVASKAKSAVSKVASSLGSLASKGLAAVGSLGTIKSSPLDYSGQSKVLNSPGVQAYNQVQAALNTQKLNSALSLASGTTPRVSSGATGSWEAPRVVSGGSTPLRTTANTSSSAFDTNPGLSFSDFGSYTQPRSYTVNSDSLGSGGATGGITGASAVLPSAPATPDYSGDIALINASLGVGTAPQTATTETVTNPQSSFDAYLKQQQKDQAKYEQDTTDALKQAREDAGIEAAQQRVQNTQNQINAITGQMNADLLKLRGTAAREGVVEAVYGGQQNEITREATIKLLPLQAQLAADQGNLEQAEDNLNTLYSLYSKQVESRYNFRKQVLDRTYEFFTAAEKRKLDQQDKQDQFKMQRFNDQNDFLQNAALQALKDGNTLLFSNLTKLQLPTNYTSPDWERQMQNVMNDASKVMAKYGGSTSGVTLTPEQQSDPFISLLAQTKGGKPLTDTFAQKLDKGLTVLGQIGVLQNNVKDVKTGPIVGAFKGANPWDTNAQTIKAQLNAIVPNLARGVYGEVGVLTDNDIKTYSSTLPNLKSTEDVRNAVLGITVDLIGKSIQRTLQVNAANGKDVSGFIDLYQEMKDTRDSIFSQIPGYKGAGTKSLQQLGVSTKEEQVFDSVVGSGSTGGGFFSNLWKGLFGN